MTFRLKDVTFHYPTAKDGKRSLKDVTAELPADEVIAVLGPSGCGKTTLLNLLALLWEEPMGPGGGDYLKGEIIYRDGNDEYAYRDLIGNAPLRAWLRREHFGSVLQNCYLLPHFTCLENVCLPLALQGWNLAEQTAWAEALIQTADDLVKVDAENGLFGIRNNMPRDVSLGQKQRMAVLRALIHNPRVVFADEPTSNLDRINTHAILYMLMNWQRGLLHRVCACRLLESDRTLPENLKNRLRSWQEPQSGHRTLVLVCHEFEPAKSWTNRALLFNEDHHLVGDFTPDRWGELDAELGRLLKMETLRIPRP